MARISSFKCECGNIKGPANRWLLGVDSTYAYSDSDSNALYSGNAAVVSLRPWHDEMAKDRSVLHFCSDKCALTWQQKAIEEMGR